MKITWTNKALEQLNDLEFVIAKRIVQKIEELTTINSFEIKKLRGYQNLYRLRVGDYRVIFDINNEKNEITIWKVGHRKNIYD